MELLVIIYIISIVFNFVYIKRECITAHPLAVILITLTPILNMIFMVGIVIPSMFEK